MREHLRGDVLGRPQVDDARGGRGRGVLELDGAAVLLEGGGQGVGEGARRRPGLAHEGVASERRAGRVGSRHQHAAEDARVHEVLHAVRDAVDGQQVAVHAHALGGHVERGARQALAGGQGARRGHHGVHRGAGVLNAPQAAGLAPPEALDGEGLRQGGRLVDGGRPGGGRRRHGVLAEGVVVVEGHDGRGRAAGPAGHPGRRAARELLHEGGLGAEPRLRAPGLGTSASWRAAGGPHRHQRGLRLRVAAARQAGQAAPARGAQRRG